MTTTSMQRTIHIWARAACALQVACLLLFPAVAWAQPVEPQTSWTVAWDAGHNAFKRAVIGTLSLHDRQLVFHSSNGLSAWKIDLADVRRVSASRGYARESRAVVIETRAGVERHVALLDDFRFGPADAIVAPVNLALRRRLAALEALRDQQD